MGDDRRENQAYDLAWARWAGAVMVLGILAAPNKAMKQTSACPSFARAPGAGGALALAAYRRCSAGFSGAVQPGMMRAVRETRDLQG